MPNTLAPSTPLVRTATGRGLPWWWVVLGMVLACTAATVWIAQSALQTIYAGAMEAAQEFNERVVLSDETRLRKTLAAVDTLLQVVRQDYARNPRQALADLDMRLSTMQLDGRLQPQITVVDAAGNFVASTASQDPLRVHGVNVGDREYFARQRDSTTDDLQVGTSLHNRLNGSLILPITRKISGAGGQFKGLVMLTVSPVELAALDIQAPLDAQAVRALLDTRGRVIVRQTGTLLESQGDASQSQVFHYLLTRKTGSFEAASPIDGVQRLMSYRLIEPLGLISIASSSVKQIKASVESQVICAVVLISGLGLLAWVAMASIWFYVIRGRADQARLTTMTARELFLMEQLPVMCFFAWRVQGEIVVFKCNDRLLHTLECSREEVLGQPVNAFLAHGVAQQQMEAWLAAIAQSAEARSRLTVLVTRSGKQVPAMAELTCTQVFSDHDGMGTAVQAYCISLLDVSTSEELKSALAHKDTSFRRLVEVLPENILTFDAQGRLTWSNLNARDYLGLAPEGAFTEAAFDTFVHAEDLHALHAARRNMQKDPCKVQQFEVRLRRKDGAVRWLDARLVSVPDAQGGITETILVTTDIDDRKKMDERNAHAQRLVTTGQLASGLAHDFNNLLAVIIGNLDLAAHGAGNADIAKQVHVALGAAERGANLVKSMLTVAGQQVLKPTVVDLNAVVESLLPLLYQALGARVGLELQSHSEPLWVQVDTPRLESCILNLVVNARDAMPSGGRLVVQLDTALAYTHAGYVSAARLSIVDSGTGMTEAVKRRALEPFFTTKERGRGTGLGLAMVAGFVHQSGGELGIESQLGVGTTMNVMLPLTQAPGVQEIAPTALRHTTALSGRVLVVDDEAELVELLSTWLRTAGLVVHTAGNAKDAIGVLRTEPFDLVISDVVMPGHLSGFDLMEYVGDMLPSTRVLLMSGYSKEAIEDPRLQGVVVLVKPFRQADLLESVRALLHEGHEGHAVDAQASAA